MDDMKKKHVLQLFPCCFVVVVYFPPLLFFLFFDYLRFFSTLQLNQIISLWKGFKYLLFSFFSASLQRNDLFSCTVNSEKMLFQLKSFIIPVLFLCERTSQFREKGIMARATQKMAFGGSARHHLVDQPYYLKPIPHNPYLGAVHDGTSLGYNEGFSLKRIPFLYRFRHNLFAGLQTGFFSRNPSGKHVHWLEVSTIEKMRVRAFSEDAFPPMFLSTVVIVFSFYQFFRYCYAHPDITLYNLGVFTSKPWITQMRFANSHPMDKPIFRYIQRAPEFYGIEDPYREVVRRGVAVNDPFILAVQKLGLESEVTGNRVLKGNALAGPNVVEAAAAIVPRPQQVNRLQL